MSVSTCGECLCWCCGLSIHRSIIISILIQKPTTAAKARVEALLKQLVGFETIYIYNIHRKIRF